MLALSALVLASPGFACPAQSLPDHELSPGAAVAWERRLDSVQDNLQVLSASDADSSRVVEAVRSLELAGGSLGPEQLRFRALDRASGQELWSRTTAFTEAVGVDEFVQSLQLTPAGDRVLAFGSVDGAQKLALFDGTNGARLWTVNGADLPGSPSFLSSLVAIDPTGARATLTAPAAFGAANAQLVTIDLADGSVLWSVGAGYDSFSSTTWGSTDLFVFAAVTEGLFGESVPRWLRVDGATGAVLFEEVLPVLRPAGLELDATESHLAVLMDDLNNAGPFQPTATFTRVEQFDPVTGASFGSVSLPPSIAGFGYAAVGGRLLLLTRRSVSWSGEATLHGLELGTSALAWETPIVPGFGADLVGDLALELDPFGRALVAVERLGFAAFPAAAGDDVEVLAFDAQTGASVAGIPIDAGAASGSLVGFAADSAGLLVGTSGSDSTFDRESLRWTALDTVGGLDWTVEDPVQGSAGQTALALGVAGDGQRIVVLESVGGGVQLRALGAAAGTEQWVTAFDEPGSTGALASGFAGDLTFEPDGLHFGLLRNVLNLAPDAERRSLLSRIEAATGAVVWTYELPFLEGYATGSVQRNGLLWDAARNQWLVGGGTGEDRLWAIDVNGALVWERLVPTPSAAEANVFDDLSDLALDAAAGNLLVAGNHVEPGNTNDYDPYVQAFSAATGTTVWSRFLSDDPPSGLLGREYPDALSISQATGQVAVALHVGFDGANDLRGRVVALDLATGATAWERDLPFFKSALVRTRVAIHALDGELLVVGGEPRAIDVQRTLDLAAFDSSGQTVWTTRIDPDAPLRLVELVPSPDGTVLYGVARTDSGQTLQSGMEIGNFVFAVDATDGQLLWSDRSMTIYEPSGDVGQVRTIAAELSDEAFVSTSFGYLEPGGASGNDLFVTSHALPQLTGSRAEVSLSAGDRLDLELRAGAAGGDDAYLVLGSLTGTAGIPLAPGLSLPLTSDGWTVFTATKPNTSLLVNTLGALDASGRAAAAVDLPAGTNPALAGTVVHHAFLTIDPLANQFALTSNPLETLLVP